MGQQVLIYFIDCVLEISFEYYEEVFSEWFWLDGVDTKLYNFVQNYTKAFPP